LQAQCSAGEHITVVSEWMPIKTVFLKTAIHVNSKIQQRQWPLYLSFFIWRVSRNSKLPSWTRYHSSFHKNSWSQNFDESGGNKNVSNENKAICRDLAWHLRWLPLIYDLMHAENKANLTLNFLAFPLV